VTRSVVVPLDQGTTTDSSSSRAPPCLPRTTQTDTDLAGRPLKRTYADGTIEQFVWDGPRLGSFTDRQGRTQAFHFNTRGQLESITAGPGAELDHLTYDVAGRVQSWANAGSMVEYLDFDLAGHPKKTRQTRYKDGTGLRSAQRRGRNARSVAHGAQMDTGVKHMMAGDPMGAAEFAGGLSNLTGTAATILGFTQAVAPNSILIILNRSLTGTAPTPLPSTLDPREVHFMQSSIKNQTGNFTVTGNAEALADGTLSPTDLPIIRVWQDQSGKTWTLDHRRLGGSRLSGLDQVPVEWVGPQTVESQMWKMTTQTGGTSIKLKLGDGTSITIRWERMTVLVSAAKAVSDRESFVGFLAKLSADLKSAPETWENGDLSAYLSALASWIEDMDGYYQNMGLERPKDVQWNVFADALMAARVYE